MKNEAVIPIKDILLKEIEQIAVEAGEIIMNIYDGFDSSTVMTKDDQSPLTIADQKANDHIVARLKALEVSYPIISEENKIVRYEERKEYGRYWMVDPLDGTKEFIKKNGEFTVNIALCENDTPILGVVYVPAQKLLFSALQNEGAWKQKDGHRSQIYSSARPGEDDVWRIVVSRSHMNDDTKAFIEKYKNVELVPTGSSLKFLLVAEGLADCYPRLGPTMEWDTAAAQIVVQEAGGTVIRAEDDLPMTYNKENLLNPYFIVWGRRS